MLDWTSFFPYTLIASLVLFAIGIYGIVTCKKFLRAVFGIEILLLTANLLLLSFGLGSSEETSLLSDPFAQTLSLMIIAVSAVFLILGASINKLLQENNDEILEFNFAAEDIPSKKAEEQEEQIKSADTTKEDEEE
ncbi:MAG: NADH-quinone oxidoreductase subunit K [Candidatus Heimdallarchaeota archaeon]|nr:NADH-quinone oxidoreductase subunit K [Candidatus Heimdallarchaeota archaeon]MCK4289508.1 NADH-quinone oxidoreductase subunit K [Candidatus Heimdallarchaeota archaeon]